MNEYAKYFTSTIIFVVIMNIIIQMQKSQSQLIKGIGMVGMLVCVFFLYKIFTRGDELKSTKSEEPKSDGII